MANYGPDDVAVQFDRADGTLTTMSNYVRELNGVKKSAILTESHAFGDSWVEFLSVGIRKLEPITLRGFYDDTATTGPDVVFNNPGNIGDTNATRTLTITWGSTKTTTVECLIVSYERIATLDNLTMFEVVLQPTGQVTEA